MNRMGSTCSMQRQNSVSQRGGSSHGSESPGRRFSRHSVVGAIPDDSISKLYPTSDNYKTEKNGSRSPKSLAELCTDTLCRSLPYLNGELPSGMPQDVVDDIVSSLVKHNALNATTLRVLRNCELGSLSLAGCRGVTDEWLEPLSSPTQSITSSPQTSTYYPANMHLESMDLDISECGKSEVFYNATYEENHHFDQSNSIAEESSCSTASFESASSTPFVPSKDRLMSDTDKKDEYFSSSMNCENKREIFQVDSCMSACSATSNITLLDLRGSQRLTDRGLIQLSDLGRLEVARLDNCHSILGRGLLAFSASHRLHTLSLANCRRLTDEAIINISHLNSLEALSLGGCRCLTDRSLAAMSCLYRLKKLDLSQCDLISDSGLEELENLEEIEELSLGWCRLISDAGLDILTKQPGRSRSLRILGLARCSISDDGVTHLARLQNLEELDLNGCSNIGSSALGNALGNLTKLTNLDVSYCSGILRTSWQGRIKSLKSLELCYSGVRDSHLARLTDLPALQELTLDSCPIGDWAISHLADNNVVPNLTSLDLADTDLTDLGMVHLAKFKKLKRLSLFYCNITNGGLRHIKRLDSLEVLNLDSREIGDDGLWYLRNLTKLKSLDIFSGRITDAGCAHLAKIKSLESLELCGGGIGDLGCSMLATLEKLTSLNLSQNDRITNRGAAALAALSNLKALNLSNTRVNSAALVYFSDLMRLQSLALYGCRGIDDESHGIDLLQSGLPSLKCVRLNNGSDEDGTITHSGAGSDSESDGDDFDSEPEIMYSRRTTNVAPFQDSDGDDDDDDDDSEMEDADVAVDDRSDDSSSYFSGPDY